MKFSHQLLIATLLLTAAVAGYNLAYILHPPALETRAKTATEPEATAELIGLYRPEFILPDLAGHPHSVAEWDGRVLLINFWATWCAPCREEIPAFIAVRRQFQEKGFEIVGIAIDQPEFVTEYARDFAITYPLLYGGEDAIAVGSLYGNRQGTLPYSVLIDAKGRIAHIHNSGVLSESELSHMVAGMLEDPAENEPKRSKLP
jgi:thiol-disulfide isomerase/thioredoxin